VAATVVQLLALLASAAHTWPKWKQSPLAKWACGAVAAAGLESLLPQQLQAAAAALAELQPSARRTAAAAGAAPAASTAVVTAAAAALAAAAVARSGECAPGVLAGVLWGCVMVGCYDMLLAEVTVNEVLTAAAAAAVSPSEAVNTAVDSWLSFPQSQPEQEQQQQQVLVLLPTQAHPQLQQHQQPQQQDQSVLTDSPAAGTAGLQPNLSAQEQAQLLWALQQLGRRDLQQQVLAALLPVGTGV
jgi:hypothetical protein